MASALRVVVALLVGCLAGIAVMVGVGVPFDHAGNWPDHPREYFGPWGALFGSFAAPFAFGIALAILRREVAPRRAVRRHPVAWALVAAGFVGLAGMAAVNIPVYNSGQWPDHGREILGLWGALFGLGAALTIFLVTRVKLRGEGGIDEDVQEIAPTRNKKVGLLISAIVAGLFGLLVTYHNALWGIPLTSLEGAWLWPLAIVPLGISVLLFRGSRRS